MKKVMFLLVLAVAGCGKTSAPLSPLDAAARKVCTDIIESRAINGNSIAYLDQDPAIAKNASGQLAVTVKFSAKNEIGAASTMTARCTVSPDGKTLVDVAVKEGR